MNIFSFLFCNFPWSIISCWSRLHLCFSISVINVFVNNLIMQDMTNKKSEDYMSNIWWFLWKIVYLFSTDKVKELENYFSVRFTWRIQIERMLNHTRFIYCSYLWWINHRMWHWLNSQSDLVRLHEFRPGRKFR